MSKIIGFETSDVRFPTSETLDGSDAMNADPDYSAAYIRIQTDSPDGLEGHGFVFTIGRGNDVQRSAISALHPWFLGREVEPLLADLGGLWRALVYDSQLRWLGPEKGVMHMAIGAAVNAMWDLRAKREEKPLWLLLSELSPEAIIDLIDFRYLSDAITRDEALEILRSSGGDTNESHRAPAPGWVCRLHHNARVAGVLGRKASASESRSRERRI